MNTIKNSEAADISKTIEGYYGIGLTVPDMEIVMNRLISYQPTMWKAELRDKSYSDTAPREIIVNEIAQVFLNEDWPCFGDAAVESNFFERLKVVCETRGWSHSL